MKDNMSHEFQREMSNFVERNVVLCVSSLVITLARMADEKALSEWSDDLYSACESDPNYQEAAEADGWKEATDGRFFKDDDDEIARFYLSVNLAERGMLSISVHTATEPGQGTNAPEVWQFVGTVDESRDLDGSGTLDITDTDELATYLISAGIIPAGSAAFTDEDCDYEVSNADTWQELCESELIDTDDYRSEVYEHWVVSSWFAEKLSEHGEKIIDDLCGIGPIWCRTCTGQAISMDCTPIAIYRELMEKHPD